MSELIVLGIDSSAASIVRRYGEAAADRVAAEAVTLLEARDFDGYVKFKQILKDVEGLLAGRGAAEAN